MSDERKGQRKDGPDVPDPFTESTMDIWGVLGGQDRTAEAAPSAPASRPKPPGKEDTEVEIDLGTGGESPAAPPKAIRVVVCDPSESNRAQIKLQLDPQEDVWLDGEADDMDDLAAMTAKQAADVAIVRLPSRNPEDTLTRIHELRTIGQVVQVLVISDREDAVLLRACMRAGVSGYLVQPFEADELAAAFKSLAELAPNTRDIAPTRRGKVFAVTGTTGGVGATTLAVNLAVGLSEELDRKVILVDMDLVRGDVDHMLDLKPQNSLATVAQNLDRLDLALLARFLTPYSDRLHVLPAPVRQDRSDMITADMMRRVLQLLRANFSHVVIDLGRVLSERHWATMEACDQVLIVTRRDVPALHHTARIRDEWTRRGMDIAKAGLVLMNHPCDEPSLLSQQASDALATTFVCELAEDLRSATKARSEGKPLVEMFPRSKLTRDIKDLCGLLSPVEQTSGKKKGGILGGWLSS